MFKIKLPIFLIFIFPFYSLAQTEESTVENRLQEVKILVDSSQYEEAQALNQKILFDYLKKQDKQDTITAKIYNNISYVFLKHYASDSAIVYANKALVVLNNGLYKNHHEQIKSFKYLGNSFFYLRQFDKAFDYYFQGLELVRQYFGENHIESALLCSNIGLCFKKLEEYKKAIDYYETSLNIFLNFYPEKQKSLIGIYNGIGGIFFNIGDHGKALEYVTKAFEIQQEKLGENHPDLARFYVNIGSISLEKGDFEKGKTFAKKGLQLSQQAKIKNYDLIIVAHRILGGTYEWSEDYTKTIQHYNEILEIINEHLGAYPIEIANVYFDLGKVYARMGNFKKAINYTKQSREIYINNFGKGIDFNLCNELLARINIKKGNYDKAIDYLNQCLVYHENKTLKQPDIGWPYFYLGKAYTGKKEFSRANNCFNKSAQSIHYDFDTPGLFGRVRNLFLLREILDGKRNYFVALHEYFKDEKYLDSIYMNDQSSFALEDYYQRELSERESRFFHSDDVFDLYEKAIQNLIKRQSPGYLLEAFKIAEKGKSRLLNENFRAAAAKKNVGVSDQLLEEEGQINFDITYYGQKLFQEQYESAVSNDSLIKAYENRIFDLKEQKESFIKKLQSQYPTYHQLKYDHSVTSVKDIQAQLNKGQSLLEYFVGDSSIFLFVITPDQYSVIPIKKDFPLEEWIHEFRENIYGFWMIPEQSDSVYYQKNEIYIERAYQIYQKIFSPIEHLITEQLIIIPDGILNFVPFDALLYKPAQDANAYRTHAYLLKKYQISYNYSATLFKRLSERKSTDVKKTLLAFAPSFTGEITNSRNLTDIRSGFGALKYNVAEAETAQALLGGDLFIGSEATEEQFLTHADQYRIIHLSTHSKSNDQMGDYSFIAFSETPDSVLDKERLYVRELYNMQLSADLVVLSACETGLGEMKRGEGVISLARGFTYAGAASTLTSLWRVNDIQTTQLMQYFYENIKEEMPKDKAIQQAKLRYLAETDHADPYFWSGFIAMGNMNPINLPTRRHWWWLSLAIFGILGLMFLVRRFKLI